MHVTDALKLLHSSLQPVNYIEIGCRKGECLALASCPSVAVAPDFAIEHALHAPTRFFRESSADFFSRFDLRKLLDGPVDLALIRDTHNAASALQVFVNLEKNADARSIVLVHFLLSSTAGATGSIYKLIPVLRRERPDLIIDVFETEAGGLAAIGNLDPGNSELSDRLTNHHASLIDEHSGCDTAEAIRDQLALRPAALLREFAGSLATRRPTVQAQGNHSSLDLYLELLKRSLLNEIYLDDELRLLYLRDCLAGTDTFEFASFHDIRGKRRAAYKRLRACRQVGDFLDMDIRRSGFAHTMIGRKRLDSLQQCLEQVVSQKIPGDFMECGVWRGGACIFMAGFLVAHGMTDRKVFVADSFDGLPESRMEADLALDLRKNHYPELAVDLKTVKENFSLYGLLLPNIEFLKGWFKDTLPHAPVDRLAVLRLDGDLYESTMDALTNLYDRVSPGGIVIVDDYVLPMCRQALNDFFASRDQQVPEISRIDWAGARFIKPL